MRVKVCKYWIIRVYLEALVPLLDGGLVVASVSLEELHVFFGQFFFAPETPHRDSLTPTHNLQSKQKNIIETAQ